MQMLPALSRAIIASTGGDQMQMGMVLPIAPMGVNHRDRATPEDFAPNLAKEGIQALHTAAHQRAQQNRGVVMEGRAEHGRDRQHNVAIEHSLMEYLAHMTNP